MFKQKPFPFSCFVLFVLITLHLIGSYFSWYWSYPWFDTVVHVLAGTWAALVFLWLASYLNQINSLKEYRVKSFLIALVSAAIVGVVWELVENFGQMAAIMAPGYPLNTATDLISDIFGGVLAYLYFIKRTRCVGNACDLLHPLYGKVGVIDHQA